VALIAGTAGTLAMPDIAKAISEEMGAPKGLASGKDCVWPTSIPVVGSASMAMSGTARPVLFEGTTPF